MKNSLILLFCLFFAINFNGQIVIRNENWPNTNWTITGNYTPTALISNPTEDSNLYYDTSLATPVGVSTLLYVTSPILNLMPAFESNEKFLQITFNIAYVTNVPNVLYIQYWNADNSSWILFPEGSAPVASVGDHKTCTFDPVYSIVHSYLDFSSFSSNELQNFRYRFVVDGTNSEIAGVCVSSVFVNSFSCISPSDLSLLELSYDKAVISWVNNGVGMQYWDIGFGLKGFVLDQSTYFQTSVSSPYTFYGLMPNTSYDFYIRKDCTDFEGPYKSDWVGPLSFTTKSLSVNEFNRDEVKLYPNPTHGKIEINALNAINEISVFDLAGQMLMNLKNLNSDLKMDLADFKGGLYFIKVITDKGFGTYKVVKF